MLRFIAFLLLSAAFPSFAASFDCAKAKSKAETLICSDSVLSPLDDRLAEAYSDALARSSDRDAIVRWQREWLKSYPFAACKDARCLAPQFEQRIQLLAQVSSEDANTSWTGSYTRVINRKDDNSAKLILIRFGPDKLFVSGAATWTGSNPGQVNTGEINGVATLSGLRAAFDLDECKGVFSRSGARIVVESESVCGGLNVSFVGEYRRK